MPQFESCLVLFTTMRRVNGSFLLSIGLYPVYGKDSTIRNVHTVTLSCAPKCSPWKIFNQGLRVRIDNAIGSSLVQEGIMGTNARGWCFHAWVYGFYIQVDIR